MTVDIFEKAGVISDDTDAEARLAVKVFRSLQPTLTSYARALTGRLDVRVELAARDNGSTDGTRIYYRPPIALGKRTQHVRRDCDRRDSDLQLICPACAVREDVLSTIYHEIAHICFDSFAKTSDYDKAEAIKFAIREAKGKWAEDIALRVKLAPRHITSTYIGLASTVNEYLPFLLNCLEDARVNAELFKARKGTKVMFEASTRKVFENGVEQKDQDGNIIVVPWREYKLNAQAMIGCFVKASGYEYTDWFHPKVIEALNDEQLTHTINRIHSIRNATGIYYLSFEVLQRLRELGFCGTPQDPDPEPEEEEDGTEESDSQEDEADPSEAGSSGGDSVPEESGSGDDSPSDDSESGEPEGSDMDGKDQEADEPGPNSEPDEQDSSSESDSKEGDESDAGSGSGEDREESGSDNDSDEDTGSDDAEADSSSDGSADGEDRDGLGGSEDSPDRGEDADSDSNDSVGEAPTENSGEDQVDGDTGQEEGSDSTGQPEPDSDSTSPGSSDGSGSEDNPPESGGSGAGTGEPGESTEGSGDSDPSVDEGDHLDKQSGPQGEGDLDNTDVSGTPGLDSLHPDSDPSDGDSEDESSRVDESRRGDSRDSSSEPEKSESEEPVDSGADDGYGGTSVENDDVPDALPEPDYGEPDDVDAVLKMWGDHDEKPKSIGDATDEAAVDRAIIQGIYFTMPSKRIYTVREHFWDQPHIIGKYNMSSAWASRWRSDRKVGKQTEMEIDESIIQPALMAARIAFSDNQRGAEQRHRKSGKVDGRVLGKRAHFNDERLFKRKILPGKKDYFVMIAMDISGSTIGKNIALEKKAVLAQAELLNRLGVGFAIYAHTGYYHDRSNTSLGMDVEMYHIKDAHEAWNDKTQERLATIGPASANLDGHSLEFYRKQIENFKATDKIILYFTDGKMPAENHDEELEILQREIQICKKQNITLLGVGIRTDSPIRHGLDTVQVNDEKDLIKVVKHLEKRLLRR